MLWADSRIRLFADSRIPKLWFVNTQTGYRYQTTCSIHTPANNAALKALAIAEGGTTVVPKSFSGEFFGHFFGKKVTAPRHEGKAIFSENGSWRHKLKQECLCFDKLPLLGKAQVGKAFSPSQCGKSHYPSRTTENSVMAETIRSLPFSGGSLRNISKALSTSQAPESSCRWTPLSWAGRFYSGYPFPTGNSGINAETVLTSKH